jgi:hypothetical protein
MIGVETLPEKKKSESWKFDEGVFGIRYIVLLRH